MSGSHHLFQEHVGLFFLALPLLLCAATDAFTALLSLPEDGGSATIGITASENGLLPSRRRGAGAEGVDSFRLGGRSSGDQTSG